MITALEHTFTEKLKGALDEAGQLEEPVILSQVKTLHEIKNPLQFYAAGEQHFSGSRFYWATPGARFTICGLGSECTVENDAVSDRFGRIETEWKRFKNIVHHEDSESFHIGTGALLFGGFSFDPHNRSNEQWSHFPESKFFLPSVMLTVKENASYLTINRIIRPDDELEDCALHFTDLANKVLAAQQPVSMEPAGNYSLEEEDTQEWMSAVEKATASIKGGKLDKVVLAREVSVSYERDINVYAALNKLQIEQPGSFIFSIEIGSKSFIGATPERLIKKEGSRLLSTCLAGSIKRGDTKHEDTELGTALLNDEKNLIEHDIVVKMIKDSFEECCSEIRVPDGPQLLKTKNIQHLYTPIEGTMHGGRSLLSLVEKLHPTPALGGYPKAGALEMIRDIEPMDRGWYAGPVGWLDSDNNGEFAVAIRSGLIDGEQASLFAGCGIVAESDPQSEYQETLIKLKPMLSALGGMQHEQI
ncbi:isochorismate synthase [Metabacillus indicus]|uniref:Isochorismate synthase MenF n=1 Tax=Metabacillus indicus TaxID=246786 RepID=A0A084GR08_METID|nr:isochorismate synthase [Metabacillus indicus]KEZ49770.1 hypothetical protein GS18_0214580 [Metabacillus indicus]